ncbi:MAG: ArsB/NhaD family transporter [Anaerolineae bacterium]|nr:ArsB/NhaD family transporter [Anaerolineae bacterium]
MRRTAASSLFYAALVSPLILTLCSAQDGRQAGQDLVFWLMLGIFVLFLAAIGFHVMHETSAALLGAVIVWLFSYIGGTFSPSLRIIDFQEAMTFVDWNVIFLILGMMIFKAMLSETSVFRWLGYQAFRLTKGSAWLLGLILILLTGVTSSLVDNVTSVLLVVPLSIEIAQTVRVHPFAFVVPEVLAANIGGAATLVGDPPSTIVGSYLGLGFFEYAAEAALVVLVSLALLVGLWALLYRRELGGAKKDPSPALIKELEAQAKITDPVLLRKAGVMGLVTLALFMIAGLFELPLGVAAMTGAVCLIVWVQPDMYRMTREVDWTTLLFFIGVFVLVGGLENAGVIDWITQAIVRLAGNSLTLATVLMVWVSGLVSGIVDNIPFTVAALPVAEMLSNSIPAASGNPVLYWALILGADMGGNLTYVGASANIVAIGILAQAGYRITFGRFLRDGALITVATLVVATIWLLVRY